MCTCEGTLLQMMVVIVQQLLECNREETYLYSFS